MATESGKMSQHRRQGANPRGFEGSADPLDGRGPSEKVARDAFWLGGVARN